MAVVLNGDGTIIGLHNVVTDDSAAAIAILKADSAIGAYVEDDPVFLSHDASAVTTSKITNWDTAYGWGDHSTEGYISSLGDAAGVTSAKITNWDTAYGWGDHSTEGYLTSLGDAAGVTSAKITNWDTAHGWGDHGAQGYATTTYVDSAVSALIDTSPAALDTLNELAAALGDDPNFSTTIATSIGTKWTQDNAKITNWDTAYGWGDHSTEGYSTATYTANTTDAGTYQLMFEAAGNYYGTGNFTIKPTEGVTINGAGSTRLKIVAGTSGMRFIRTATANWIQSSTNVDASGGGLPLNFSDGGGANTWMRINASGNVFIGRTSTTAAATDHGLQFYNTGEVYQFGSATGNSDLHRWYNGSGTKVAYLQGDGDLTLDGGLYLQRTLDNSPALGMRQTGSYDLEIGNYGGNAVSLIFNSNGYATFDKNVAIGSRSDPYDSAWGTTSKQLRIIGERYGVLHLESNSTSYTDTKFSIGAGDGKHWVSYDDNDGRHNITVDADGNVGINQVSPTSRFHIHDDNTDRDMDIDATGQFHIDGNGYGFGIALGASVAALYTNSANRPVVIGVNETERLRVHSTGVSVTGSLASTTVATISGNTVPLIVDSGAAQGAIQYKSNGTIRGYVGNGSYLLTGANAAEFIVRSENNLYLTYNGNNDGLRVSGNGTRIKTIYGNVEIGALNTSYTHYITDRPKHYFNTTLEVNGNFNFYQGNSFTSANVGEWNTAYGWGDHGTEGYAVKSESNSFTNSYNEFGNGTGSVSNDGSWHGRVNVAGASHAKIEAINNADGIITSMQSHVGHNSGRIGTRSGHKLGLMSSNTVRAEVDSTGVYSNGTIGFMTDSTDGRGYKFWGVGGSYSLHMSTKANAFWGGAMAVAPTSDYNIYFRNSSGGTNRGFVFQDSNLDTKAQVTGDGDLFVKGHVSSPFTNNMVAKYTTTSGSTVRLLITTPFVPSDNTMFRFTIDLYSSYHKHTYDVSGYAYNSPSNWYLPKAIFRGDTGEAADIIFGKTASGYLYVSVASASYVGASVHSLTMGYNGTDAQKQRLGWSITRSNTVVNQIAADVNDMNKSHIYGDSTGNRAVVLTDASGTDNANSVLYKDAGTSLYFNTSNNTLVCPSFSGNLSGNAATATLASTATVTGNSDAAWKDVVLKDGNNLQYASGVEIYPSGSYLRAVYLNMSHGVQNRPSDTVFFSSADDYIRKNDKAGMQSALGIGAGAVYLDVANGNYGTVKVDDDRGVTWAGYAVRDDWVLMSNGSAECGIYNDTDNEWMTRWFRNAQTEICYNGVTKLQTTSAGISVSGRVAITDQLAYIAPNYGHGVFGVYSATRYQHVWSMGTAYKTSADGTSAGNMYGLTYTHTNIGTGTNQAISGLAHQLQGRNNGTLIWALGTGIWTSGNITAYSDRAVKTNLEVIPDALEKVKSISGYTYDRTDFEVDEATGEMPDTRQAGVVAQEVEKILPEVVSGEEGNKAVAYGNMVALLIEAVKELSAEVDALKAGK